MYVQECVRVASIAHASLRRRSHPRHAHRPHPSLSVRRAPSVPDHIDYSNTQQAPRPAPHWDESTYQAARQRALAQAEDARAHARQLRAIRLQAQAESQAQAMERPLSDVLEAELAARARLEAESAARIEARVYAQQQAKPRAHVQKEMEIRAHVQAEADLARAQLGYPSQAHHRPDDLWGAPMRDPRETRHWPSNDKSYVRVPPRPHTHYGASDLWGVPPLDPPGAHHDHDLPPPGLSSHAHANMPQPHYNQPPPRYQDQNDPLPVDDGDLWTNAGPESISSEDTLHSMVLVHAYACTAHPLFYICRAISSHALTGSISLLAFAVWQLGIDISRTRCR
jgi:hypothetical protein